MSGRPLLNSLQQRIDALGTQDVSGEDVLFLRIADGEPIGRLAKELGVSRPFLYTWRDMGAHVERRRPMWEAAVKASAHAKAEEGESILDTLVDRPGVLVTPADVNLAKARAEYKRWMAGVRDRESYGAQPAVNLSVSIGTLHLDALRAVCVPVIAGAVEQGAVVEAELLLAAGDHPTDEEEEWSNA